MTAYRLFLSGPPKVEVKQTAVSIPTRKSLALLSYLAIERQLHHRNQLIDLFWPDLDQERGRAALRRELSRLNKVLGDGWRLLDGETVQISSAVWVDVRTVELAVSEEGQTAVSFQTGQFMAGFGIPDSPDFDHWQQAQTHRWQQTQLTYLLQLAQRAEAGGAIKTAVSHTEEALQLDPLHTASTLAHLRLLDKTNQPILALQRFEAYKIQLDQALGVAPPNEIVSLVESLKVRQQTAVSPPQTANRNRGWVWPFIGAGLLVLVAVGTWFGWQRWQQLEQRVVTANSNKLVAQSQAESELDLKLLLAVAAVQQDDSFVAHEALFSALNSLPPHLVTRWQVDTAVTALATNPDQHRLATGTASGTIQLWDSMTFQPVGSPLGEHSGRITALVFMPHTPYLVSSGQDGTIRFWHSETGEAVGAKLQHESGSVTDIAIDKDAEFLLSGGSDGLLRLWDLRVSQTNPPLLGTPTQAHDGAVTAVSFFYDRLEILSVSGDPLLNVWAIQDELILQESIEGAQLIGGVENWIDAVTLGKVGYYGSSRFGEILYIPTTMESEVELTNLAKVDTAVLALAYDYDTDLLFAGDDAGQVWVWDIRQERPYRQAIDSSDNPTLFIKNNTLMVGTNNGQLSTYQIEPTLTHQGSAPYDLFAETTHWLNPVDDFFVYSTETAVIFNPERAAPWQIELDSTVNALVNSQNGALIGIGTLSGEVTVLDWQTREPVRVFSAQNSPVNGLAFSQDSDVIVAIYSNRRLLIHNIETGNRVQRRLSGSPTAVSLSPDGTQLAVGLESGVMQLYAFENNQLGCLIHQFEGHTQPIADIAFDPIGERIATASWDTTIRLWQLSTGASIVLPDHERGVSDVLFAENGRFLISSGWDNKTILWDLDVAQWQQTACQLANRDLTAEEWARYLPNVPVGVVCGE